MIKDLQYNAKDRSLPLLFKVMFCGALDVFLNRYISNNLNLSSLTKNNEVNTSIVEDYYISIGVYFPQENI